MDIVDRATRKSLPLSTRDLRDLATLRRSPTHRQALAVLVGSNLNDDASEAALLHAVWEAGLNAVLERVEEAGYEEMAAERATDTRQAVARRRRPDWSAES